MEDLLIALSELELMLKNAPGRHDQSTHAGSRGGADTTIGASKKLSEYESIEDYAISNADKLKDAAITAGEEFWGDSGTGLIRVSDVENFVTVENPSERKKLMGVDDNESGILDDVAEYAFGYDTTSGNIMDLGEPIKSDMSTSDVKKFYKQNKDALLVSYNGDAGSVTVWKVGSVDRKKVQRPPEVRTAPVRDKLPSRKTLDKLASEQGTIRYEGKKFQVVSGYGKGGAKVHVAYAPSGRVAFTIYDDKVETWPGK